MPKPRAAFKLKVATGKQPWVGLAVSDTFISMGAKCESSLLSMARLKLHIKAANVTANCRRRLELRACERRLPVS
jgi:hypothetical protein